ncbi:Transcriptional elongation regulator miniyo [Thalictrum thalictroides]|uniref:Transcriptional elongation regulator miniyo n=1 Tax=Thalictrum thalictroides TaxID=46969 RepID=A0A7J6VCM2_THATH|nr:Transcriptional elongation regulator miniyo [Thalictrum thalictroides]
MEKGVSKREREEEDESSSVQLVGKIIEKGFDSANNKFPLTTLSSQPRPSVLPFPVARHRSHGPHWTPISVNREIDVDEDVDHDQDEDFAFNPVAKFANPIKRKQKKSLDFSKWKEFVSQGNQLEGDEVMENVENIHNGRKIEHMDNSMDIEVNEVNRDPVISTIRNQTVSRDNTCVDESMHEDIRCEIGIPQEQVEMSLVSQIDAENRAHLQQMSTEEIVEAQSEILEKMKPGLVEMLKKRGRNKLGSKPKTVSSDVENGNQMGTSHKENPINRSVEHNTQLEDPKTQHISALKPSNHTDSVASTGGMKALDTASNKWSAWSKRVEAVRTLRFNLNGTVLENDSPQTPYHGDSNGSQSNIEKVTERDFLRTEGDPSSVGYTIKEAVALSRSTVSLRIIVYLFMILWPLMTIAVELCDCHLAALVATANYCDETGASENEGSHTIQDDVVVAGQDFAAGLIRMGIIPRIHYLLVADPSAALEEHLIAILIGLARHSPTCANAIIKFPVLVKTIADRFIKKDTLEINHAKIKSTTLLKVLSQSDKKACLHFIEKGIIRDMMWQFYRQPLSLDQWIKSGREYCKLMSALMIEQLRLWRICIQYGYCISYFADYFPILCLWLTPPTFDILIENNILGEFTSITREVYLVLEALARRLPNLHTLEQLKGKGSHFESTTEMWSWSHVIPMVESALKWISLEGNPYLSKIIDFHNRTTAFAAQEPSVSSIVWVISAVLHMLSSVLKKVAPGSPSNMPSGGYRVPWLPEFVPKIGLEVVKSRLLDFSGTDNMIPPEGGSLSKGLCQLRLNGDYESSLSSVCCLHGIVKLIVSLDNSIRSAKQESYTPSSGKHSFLREGNILEDGLFKWSQCEVRSVLITFMTLLSSNWRVMQWIETFSRGGPAPGVGLGWGASGGGFWSKNVLLGQTESLLLMELSGTILVVLEREDPTVEEVTFTLQRVKSVLEVCLIVGPRDTIVLEKAFDFLLQVPILKYLDLCVHGFLQNRGIKTFGWKFKEDDYLHFSEILKIDVRNRWLCVKQKSKPVDSNHDSDLKKPKKGGNSLGTIYEDSDAREASYCDSHCTSKVIEWAQQRLPLPMHWFLSPLLTINDGKGALDKVLEVAKSGIFFLLGLEATSSFPCTTVKSSPVDGVPLIWKVHSLSVVLLVGMGVLQDDQSRDMYRALQDLYGQILNETRRSRNMVAVSDKSDNLLPESVTDDDDKFLKFKSDVHESYTTFIETFVEQFGATSYGDVIFGRQVSLYLHHAVESPVRLAAWNALSNAHILELLPTLEECFAEAEGYLDVENNEGILEAYAKSWVSDGLDKAALRGSMTFTLALHHLSSCLFYDYSDDKLLLRNKLAKSLLRDYSRKQRHEGMILNLIRYTKSGTSRECVSSENPAVQKSEIERRLRLLAEACEGNSTLLIAIEKLKSSPKLFHS